MAFKWAESYIGSYMTTYETGYFVGKAALSRGLPPKGQKFHLVIPMEVAGAPYAVDRSAGFRQALKDAGYKEGIDYTFEELDAGYETTTTESRINAYLLGHPETKVIYNVGGLTTDRAGVVVQKLGKKPGEILVFGNDLLPETAVAIQKGYNQGVFYGQQYLVGFVTVVQAYLVLKWNFAPWNIEIGASIIDKSNVEASLAYVAKGIY
jgi:simple sugar transport system substrate-binding protein